MSMAREIRPSTLTIIDEILGAPQLSIAGPRDDLEQIRTQRPLTTLENCLMDRLIEESVSGPLPTDVLSRCVEGALTERIEANMRATEIHVQVKSPRDRPELMHRMRACLRRVDLEATSAAVLERRVCQPRRREHFDWEENLGARK